MSIQIDWAKIGVLETQFLKEGKRSVYLYSLDPPRGFLTTEGSICEASPRIAAIRIVDGTHRIATDDEIKRFEDEGIERLKLVVAMDRRSARLRSVRLDD